MFWLWWISGLTISTILGSWTVSKYRHLGFSILAALFVGYVLSANILVPRLVELNLGIGMYVLTTGSIIWPFIAQLSDMINEIYGRKKAYLAVIMAYVVYLLFISFLYLGSTATPLWSPENESFWQSYFNTAPRILIASSASFLICQSVDIAIFSKLKQFFLKRERPTNIRAIVAFCTLRSVTSDLANMILDGLLFTIFAFLFVLPSNTLFELIIGSITAKGLLAVLDTPWFIIFRVSSRNVEREL